MNRLHLSAFASALGLVLLLGLAAPAPTPRARPAEAPDFLVRGVRLFDGERIWPRAAVRVRGGLIEAVAEDLAPRGGERVIDGAGKTLLPGLIDAHVHSFGNARRDALRFGVTTQVDLFTDYRQLPAARSERESLARSDRADLWSAGTLATAAGGHGTQFGMAIPTVDSVDTAPEWVAARKAEGSDFIKIVREDLSVYTTARSLPSLDAERARAVIEATHAQGLRAVVHASAQAAARESLRDGADGLVHMFQDAVADEAFVEFARERGTVVVPTLTVIAGVAGERSRLGEDARIAPWLGEEQRSTLDAGRSFGVPRGGLIANARESVRRLHAAGVPILAGTDAPNPNTAHGASLHEELAQLVAAGLSPLDALKAATSRPADAIGLPQRGRIAAGHRADLILVEGEPDTDIEATRAIVSIWKTGYAVDRSVEAMRVQAFGPGPIGDFEQGIDAPRGSGWAPTTDAMVGGRSTARVGHGAPGAQGSAGALRVEGEVVGEGPQVWAGAFFSPGAGPMQPVDASGVRELAFRLRGDGREVAVLMFHGDGRRSPPISRRVPGATEWSEHRVDLTELAGLDVSRLSGIGFAVSAPAGAFVFELDDVELR
jgi:imidazolonepropionase-like amidohydrolase